MLLVFHVNLAQFVFLKKQSIFPSIMSGANKRKVLRVNGWLLVFVLFNTSTITAKTIMCTWSHHR